MENVVDAYLSIKNALVNDNAEMTSEQAKKMQNQLKQVEMGLLTGEAHTFWMHNYKEMQSQLIKMNTSSTLKDQRIAFSQLSNSMISTVKSFGTNKNKYYIQFCSMANGKKEDIG